VLNGDEGVGHSQLDPRDEGGREGGRKVGRKGGREGGRES
jgi:hypothetical protein